jgi:hypothetical protein
MKKAIKVRQIKSKVKSVREIKKDEQSKEEVSKKDDVEFQEVKVSKPKNLEDDVKDVIPVRGSQEEEKYKSQVMPDQADVEKNYEIEQVQIQRFEQTRQRRNAFVRMEEPRTRNTTAPPRIERETQREERSDRRGENYIPQGEVKRSERRKMPWE